MYGQNKEDFWQPASQKGKLVDLWVLLRFLKLNLLFPYLGLPYFNRTVYIPTEAYSVADI